MNHLSTHQLVGRRFRNSVLWGGAIVGALAVGMAGARVFEDANPPSSIAPYGEILQSSSAVSQGVELKLIAASFSGSESQVRLNVLVRDESALRNAVGGGERIERVAPSGTNYTGPFDGAPITSTMNRLGETVLVLPAVQVPPNYDGLLSFHISSLTAEVDGRVVVVEGSWPLVLAGPSPTEIATQLRREELEEATVLVEGQAARTSGFRTISETRIAVELPPGMSMITASVLRVDGKRIPARSFGNDGQVVTTSFPPTDFGGSVEFELGTLAMFRGEPSTVTVSMKDALDAADGDETFAIPASAVLSGDPARVISGEQGRYGTRKWVGIEVVGNWQSPDPEAPPHMFDGNGVKLLSAHVISSYRKDVNGTVGEGTSKIAAFITGDTNLDQLTLVLSPSTVPTGQEYVVGLRPK